MSRISIDVSDAEHQKLKAMAALQGKSIKEFVLARTIGEQALEADLAELETVLRDRVAAKGEQPNTRTVGDVFQQARKDAGPSPGA
jgi:hypothetical protein